MVSTRRILALTMTQILTLDTATAALAKTRQGSSDYDLNRDVQLPKDRVLRDAAVLVLVSEYAGSWVVTLTKRSSALRHHPGQIAFPGGKRDDADDSIIATAFREAHEEIGLPRGSARIAGTLPNHETVTGFTVTPVIAILETAFELRIDRNEVDEAFSVPLSFVLAKQNFQVQSRRWRGHNRAYFTVPFGPYYIWGATARILFSWADAVAAT